MKTSLIVLLSLWIGSSVFGMEAAYRRGVEAMTSKADGGHGVWSVEYGIGVLRRHSGTIGEALALKLAVRVASLGKEGDLLDGLREVVCGGCMEVLARFEGTRGGWAVEQEGEPEMWGTLLAMECLLELAEPPAACGRGWKWLVRCVTETGAVSCNGRGGKELRTAGQFLTVAGLSRRHGWGLDSASKEIVQEVLAWVKGQISEGTGDERIGCYDLSLVLRGLCLLGMQEDGTIIAEKLVERQLDNGSWQDDTVADDWLVTCAVVEALGGYLTACRMDGGVKVSWKKGEETALFGAREYAQVYLAGLDDDTVVTLEVMRKGTIIDYRYIGRPDENGFSWFTGTHEPGDYKLRVVFWDDNGLSWLGEVSLNFAITEDAICHNVSWAEPARDKILHGGDDWCDHWTMSWDYDGNMTETAALSWNLSFDGDVLESGERSVVLSPSNRHVRVNFGDGPHVAPTVAGEYELTGRLTTSKGEFACLRRLTVVCGAVYDVENDVSPQQITLGTSRLRHTLKVRCVEEEEFLAVGGFTVVTEDRRIIDETNERLVVELSDIHGADGRLMSFGWLAVQAFYGKCMGDMDLGRERVEGFLCGVCVMDGHATIVIDAEGKGRSGTTAVSVYQLQSDGLVIGEKLGQFEIHWMERQ